jgi:hypothetical protein
MSTSRPLPKLLKFSRGSRRALKPTTASSTRDSHLFGSGVVARYITDRHLPDKAIDVIDEAGAAQRILPKSKQKKVINKTDIEEIVAKIARIPRSTSRWMTAAR